MLKVFSFFIFIVNVWVFCLYALPMESGRKCGIFWDWSYRWLQATMWEL